MPTVQDIRIDFEITQPRLLLNAVDGVNPTDYAYIVFSQWYKGDKGDKGDPGEGIPPVTGQDGKFLKTDGTDTFWEDVDALPSQSGNAGKFLTTNGTEASWTDIDALPDQTGQNGKFLKTNGSEASWDEVPEQVNADWEASSGPSKILHKPTLGTASELDVAESGNASTTQVVKGDDTRLSDSRNAADVYPWAKASTKPSYTASEVGAIASSEKGSNNGVAELDATGKVPSSQLPSYVDDVLEYASLSAFPATGDSGKIYVALDTNKTYRWSGSAYVEISESLALGETSSTAYAGNKGKANAEAIAAIKDGTTIDSFGDVETALAGKQDTLQSMTTAEIDTIWNTIMV